MKVYVSAIGVEQGEAALQALGPWVEGGVSGLEGWASSCPSAGLSFYHLCKWASPCLYTLAPQLPSSRKRLSSSPALLGSPVQVLPETCSPRP